MNAIIVRLAYSIDKEVKHIMDECYQRAITLLTENRDKLDIIAETLMERETIEAAEFVALMEGRSLEELDKQKEELLAEQKALQPEGVLLDKMITDEAQTTDEQEHKIAAEAPPVSPEAESITPQENQEQ